MSNWDNKELINEMNESLRSGVPVKKILMLAEIAGVNPTLLDLPPEIVLGFQSQKGLTTDMASYYEEIEKLEQRLAAGTATYSEKQLAERLGVPMHPTRVSFKDLGYTHLAIKAGSVDPDKLNTLINALRGLSLDLALSMTGVAFIPSATPEQRFAGVIQSLSEWIQLPTAQGQGQGTAMAGPGMAAQGTGGGTGVTKINSRSLGGNTGGAGASSSIRPGGSAGANPKPSQAAQKATDKDGYGRSAETLFGKWSGPGGKPRKDLHNFGG